MNKRFREHWPFLILLVVISGFHLWGINRVPFHPDEATQLYMSSDFETLFTQPGRMAWDPAKETEPRQRYRELDAPLTKYILGIGRQVFGLDPLPTDWDWGKTWEENDQLGALPGDDLLFAGRLAVTLLIPFSLLLIYLLGNHLGGRTTGFLAAFFLGAHALTLLHARRAMAEGTLTFGVVLALWGLLQAQKRPWLAGLGMAIAFNTKQSTIALLPAGVVAACFATGIPQRYRKIAWNLFQFGAVFGLVTFALNPLFWGNPTGAVKASLAARQDLLQRQTSDTGRLVPEQLLRNPGQRIAVITANLFLVPPMFSEVGNYREQTAASEEAYLSIPGHRFLNGNDGGLYLLFSLFGLVIATKRAIQEKSPRRRSLILVLLAAILQAASLVAVVPLPWQRYVMPLVPLTSIWAAYGAAQILISIYPRYSRNLRRILG